MSNRAPRIDQLLAGVADGDATSHAAFAMRDAFRALGHASDIFALPDYVAPGIRAVCRDVREYTGHRDDLVLHHYGMYSPATDIFRAAPSRKILLYHNVTPSTYFRGYDDALVEALERSRNAVPALARECDAVWTVSTFNARELTAMGVADVRVWPLPFVPAALNQPPDPHVQARLRAPLTTLLCVGRVAPNKAIEELIEAYAWYHACYNKFSRLLIVGSPRSTPKYFTFLRLLARDVGIPNICFAGFASPAGLATYYARADVFLNVSRHEGYCLPILEAMYKGVPVISRLTGGTPESLGGAGVGYDHLSAPQLAALMHLVLSDAPRRNDILASQQDRMRREKQRDLAAELAELLK